MAFFKLPSKIILSQHNISFQGTPPALDEAIEMMLKGILTVCQSSISLVPEEEQQELRDSLYNHLNAQLGAMLVSIDPTREPNEDFSIEAEMVREDLVLVLNMLTVNAMRQVDNPDYILPISVEAMASFIDLRNKYALPGEIPSSALLRTTSDTEG